MAGQEPARRQLVVDTLLSAARVHEALAHGPAATVIADAGALLVSVLAGGGQVLVFGNGGSAADAQHFAAELVGRFVRTRRGWPALALTTDSSVLTAVANDSGFELVFARQVEALGRVGDLAMGISTSGASPNVVRGLEAAGRRGLRTIALTGNDGGAVGRSAEVHVNVPDAETARVQEAHATVLHLLCAIVDQELEG